MGEKANTLFNSVMEKWQQGHVVFKREEVLAWVDKKPETESASSMLAWANEHPFISVTVTPIPDGIIDGGQFALHDIKVRPPRSKKARVMDDDVYDLFQHVRTYVPRGFAIIEKISSSGKANEFTVVVYAMKKFTGGPGDEDEEEEHEEIGENGESLQGKPKWEYYFIDPHKSTTSIYRTTKENGDSAHLSFFSFQNKIYYLVGSKNVHMLIANLQDVEKYKDPRFRVAGLIGNTFISSVEKLAKKSEFIEYMLKNKLTATFEFLQVEHQHIELFDFSESKFRFIAFTYNERPTELCFNLEEGTKVAKESGWETTTVQKYEFSEQDAVFDDIRLHTYGKEGSVLYYVNAEGRAIGMMKKKTIWYIIVRAIREKEKALIASVNAKIKRGAEVDRAATIDSFRKRIETTMAQKQQWLKLTDEVTKKWIEIGVSFLAWTLPKVLSNEFDAESLINTYPLVWNQFLQETNSSDKF